MNILFLCGGLQPGCDGVGDYTRRLAGELIRNGHSCRFIALNDRYVTASTSQSGDELQDGIPSLRLPEGGPWTPKIESAHQWIEGFEVHWMILEFVPYSFHPKGLPFGLGRRLKSLGGNARWSIMFHELWIGMNIGTSRLQRLIGLVQKRLICQLIRDLAPDSITSQSSLYIAQLRTLGFQPQHLPLFGNIPICFDPIGCELSDTSLNLVVFGGIHYNAPIIEFARDCAGLSKACGRKVRLIFAGRCGPEQERWKDVWLAEGLECEVTGEITPQEISNILRSASFGVTTTPLALIEKSGAAAAMLEHSLPIINVASCWIPKGVCAKSSPAGIHEYRPTKLAEIISRGDKSEIKGNGVESVAHQLLAMLT